MHAPVRADRYCNISLVVTGELLDGFLECDIPLDDLSLRTKFVVCNLSAGCNRQVVAVRLEG